jgi:tRNA threonylcarbamoyladenosine biosynthesis protein TsaB
MLLVALESSTRSPSVALLTNGKVHAQDLDGERPHASDLLPCLADLLTAAGHAPKDIQAIAVGIGPGSYTGLRVAIATAQGLARAANAPLIAIPSGEATAHAELHEGERGDLILDARGGSLYHARFERTAQGVTTLIAPRLVPRADLSTLLDEAQIALLDKSLADSIDPISTPRIILDAIPKASALLPLALQRLEHDDPRDPSTVVPLYLRPFEGRIRKR